MAPQSLHQIKVGHFHSVFFSFLPEGPSGRGHIQNDLPQFRPLFFVLKIIQVSPWLSHKGATGLVKSLHHDFLLSTSSYTLSLSWGSALLELDGDFSGEEVMSMNSLVGNRCGVRNSSGLGVLRLDSGVRDLCVFVVFSGGP